MRVIAAIFLKETLAAAAHDNEIVMAEVNRDPKFISQLRTIFMEVDHDKNGVITVEELKHMMHDEKVIDYLKVLGLHAHEVRGLFVLMDDGDNEITFAEFLAGVMS